MNSKQCRQHFLDFFREKGHHIVPSAPMVVKDDPTLMFTNAGMNQFKDLFLGNKPISYARIANTQKCLRVSGKHNDLEEVGHDTYHHTMFEMLGNWSFGDYFKEEAIGWAWELLVKRLGIDPDRLYATVFEGDKQDGVDADNEAAAFWAAHLPQDRILRGDKKDNFWEMGDVGPCGPCSELHIDLRTDSERQDINGRELVNKNHPQVIEVWNLVFIQYNRKADQRLEKLSACHVDTGMGFERLCMVLQGKQSNYDTDLFQPLIQEIGRLTNTMYGADEQQDVAMRVVADHLRAVAFAIADGQLPSNNKAGYVIRRILRRAIRYAYSFLHAQEPLIYQLVPTLSEVMNEAFPELAKQQELIGKVIYEEEETFLKTVSTGIKLLEGIMDDLAKKNQKKIAGDLAFKLYDTYGFSLDLTELLARERGMQVDLARFDEEMNKQKERARNATAIEAGDWTVVREQVEEKFVGYDCLSDEVQLVKYRYAKRKQKVFYELVFTHTPFYGESGGQVGDTGKIEANGEVLTIFDTQKENNLIIHYTEELPSDPNSHFRVTVNEQQREQTAIHHSATHLLHYALRKVLGEHIEQKGSHVDKKRLRFDFSHFQKVSGKELAAVEQLANNIVRASLPKNEQRDVPHQEAINRGARALFGEKYGETVRVIQFGESIELCGGTHVSNTGNIGQIVILSEGAVSAGIRRIEAIAGTVAEEYLRKQRQELKELKQLLNAPNNAPKVLSDLLENSKKLQKELEGLSQKQVTEERKRLEELSEQMGQMTIICAVCSLTDPKQMKDLCFQLKENKGPVAVILGCKTAEGKANLQVAFSNALMIENKFHAGNIIKQVASYIRGGGGGQPFYASAGGSNPDGLPQALEEAKQKILQHL